MASPRSMWSGAISLGLLNIQITIGKTWADQRESSLRDLCTCHGLPVDRTERCNATATVETAVQAIKSQGLGLKDNLPDFTIVPEGKVKGVQTEDGWRKFEQNEWDAIEDATSSDSLVVLDVQDAWDFPLEYGKGTYYVRHDKKAKGAPTAMAHFVEALGNRAAFVMWCRSAKQQPAVLHTTSDGLLLLTAIPTRDEWREPGDQETAHTEVKTDPEMTKMMTTLLDGVASNGWVWANHPDEGLKLRQAAVEKILGGQKLDEKKEQNIGQNVPDLMAQLQASVEMQKGGISMDEKKEKV